MPPLEDAFPYGEGKGMHPPEEAFPHGEGGTP